MSDNHTFCRCLLRTARQEAKERGVTVTHGLTAMQTTTGGANKQWWVEGVMDKGDHVTACCAWEAKAKWIADRTDRIVGVKRILGM